MSAPGLPLPAGATGHASAKVILVGEHSVVHGAPALVAGLPSGMTARAVGPAPRLTVSVRPWGLEADAAGDDAPGRALAALQAALAAEGVPAEALALRLDVDAGVPGGVGLGSSAALGVAVVRAVAVAADRPDLAAPDAAARLADASERVFHGRPSGADAAIAAHGGLGLFRPGRGLTPLPLGAPVALVVADTGPRPPTREMVAGVHRRLEADPALRAHVAALGELAVAASDALRRGDPAEAGAAMDRAQDHLMLLGVCTDALEAACAAARRAGAWGAKLTGAGGGGCVVALTPPERAADVAAALSSHARWTGSFLLEPNP